MADLEGSNGQRTEFRIVGKHNIPGRLSYATASGKARFAMDVTVPGMLHAKYLRSPYGRARIKSVDVGRARKLPGVVDIITWEDPDIRNLPPAAIPMLSNEADMEDEEIGVIVVAESEELCDEALKVIKVEWEALPHILDPREGRKPDAPVLRENPRGKGNVQTVVLSDGDIEAGFREADHIIEFDWNISLCSAHHPNPAIGLSWWYDDHVSSEGKNLFIEGAYITRGSSELSAMYKVPRDKLYQNTIYQGGKYCDWGLRRAALITPLLSRRTGRPVRMLNSRQNMYDLSSPQRYCNVKLGFNNDGIITAVHSNIVGDAGIRGTATFFTTLDLNWNPFYTTKCLNLKTECETVFTNTGRAYTSGQQFPFNWDELTVAIARISEKLGIDPVEIATRNIHGPSSQTDPTIPPSFQLCIDHGRKKADWKWHPAGTKKLPDGRMHGMAFRYQMCKRHANMTYQCTVAIKSDGRVYIPTRGPWGGIFGADVAAMVVAEEIGARMEDVILLYDPRGIFTPLGGGSDGSAASSWVAKEAAIACKKLLLERAAEQLRVDINDLDTGDTMVFLKSAPEKKYPFAQFAERDKDKEVAATYSGRPPIGIWNIHRGKMLDTLHTTFCEVAVDTETGEVEVLRFVVAIDPGKILRATSLESQIDQNMMIGVGSQLYEEFVFDRQTGVKLSTNMIEYKKPTILDMPPVDSVLLETRAGNGCYGANGVSHSLASTQLILCAVANAIGKWAITPPITPDKVLKALGKA